MDSTKKKIIVSLLKPKCLRPPETIKPIIGQVDNVLICFQFQQILKPSYNSVDMIEVELFDDDRAPRNFSIELTAVSV